MKHNSKLFLGVGSVLIGVPLIALSVNAIFSNKQTEINELEKLQNEQEMLLSGINYHQTQANTLSIRLGKVRSAVDALSQMEEYALTGSAMTEDDNYFVEDPMSFGVAPVYDPDYETDPELREDEDLMFLICDKGQIHGNISPVCDNWDLFYELKNISETRNVNFGMQIGIAYAESHIGANFVDHYGNASEDCSLAHNWAGLKWHKTTDNVTLAKNWRSGCTLQQFASIQEGWASMANSLDHGYIRKGCNTPECIVKWWVGKYSQRWVDSVNLFM